MSRRHRATPTIAPPWRSCSPATTRRFLRSISSPATPEKLIGAAKDAHVGRYLVVGGAGSLEVAPGVRLVTTPTFPPQYKAEAEKGAAFLDRLSQEKELNWTFLSPSALFTAGERTAKFRLGTDQLLIDRERKKLDFLRGLRGRAWPTRSSVRPISASVSRSATDGTDRPRKVPDSFACARPWRPSGFRRTAILSVTRRRYIRRARAELPVSRGAAKARRPQVKDGLALGKVEEL